MTSFRSDRTIRLRLLSLAAAFCFAFSSASLQAEAEDPLPPVEPVDWSAIRPAEISDQDALYFPYFIIEPTHSLAYYLGHFSTVANAIRDRDPARGFIDIPIWRLPKDNKPYNARIMENILSLVWFYTKNDPWNPYHGDPAVRARLEAALQFWLSIQDSHGRFSEYSPGGYALAPTAFAVKFMGESLVLLKDGPAIDPDLLEKLTDGVRRALLFIFNSDTFYRHGLRLTNQYTSAFAGALAYLSVHDDPDVETALLQRIESARSDFQSPAGYLYEGNGPDWGYYFGTHHSNTQMIWHYTRNSARFPIRVDKILLDEFTRSTEWLAYNAVPQPDGLRFYLNRAIETRQSRHSFERLNTPLAEKVLLARAFSVTAEERDVRLSENRRELAEHWGNPPPMEPDTFSWSTYTPYGFIHRNHIQWFPAEKQRREARNALPYVARNHFIHQRGDGVRHDCFFTFIRRPGYYVAFNSGEHYRSQQRLGLGLLWHPEFGTLLQSQTGTRDFAWGTRLVGGDSVAEAASINAVFIIDGKPIPPEPGARDLPDGELTVRYPVPGGEKQLRFLDDRIDVAVSATNSESSRSGNVDSAASWTEQIPLLLADSDELRQSNNAVTLIRNDRAILAIRFHHQVGIELVNGPALNGLTVRAVHTSASRKLNYSIVLTP